jgi:hypothetical protein
MWQKEKNKEQLLGASYTRNTFYGFYIGHYKEVEKVKFV